MRRITDYRLTATAAQITGSPPLLSDLDILCEMENEGPSISSFSKLCHLKYGDVCLETTFKACVSKLEFIPVHFGMWLQVPSSRHFEVINLAVVSELLNPLLHPISA